ncbi:hypothetical protein [Marispirochaeta aestuarii]|uniref:hypothetical protein n=1 Tax=Marispirochaeta aestuarii TaxID=1963862 RepID=UPI002ABDCB08|nr:hypothetical protein [Marispirochaeta aestuarii]
MGTLPYAYEHFFTREGFNSSLGHFQAVANIIPEIQQKNNLADQLNQMLGENTLNQNQLGPIVYALLVDKYAYACDSCNLKDTVEAFDEIHEAVAGWNAVDLVMTYIHPELGYLIANPKNRSHWDSVGTLRKNEIVTVYAGGMDRGVDQKTADKAVETFIKYLNGSPGKPPALLTKGSFKYSPPKEIKEPKKPAVRKKKTSTARKPAGQKDTAATAPPPARESGGGKKRMTPFYSVPVSNELFHNGNVEAWKRIIQSYQAKHPGLEVYIFYEGERIHDIAALFKWGKVKHGSTIVFAVAGEDIKDVAKLQRYLRQGASPRFEDFLRFPVNTVLNLF